MLSAAVALASSAHAYTLTPDVLGVRPAVRPTMNYVMMADTPVPMNPIWGDPREGEPFGAADRTDSGTRTLGGIRGAVEAYQPCGITDATVIMPQYIGTDDDEPWHATSRQTVTATKASLVDADVATLPFIAAEVALEAAVRAAKSAGDIKSAISAATSSGARAGSPAVVAAEKVKAAFEGNDGEAAEKAKPKAPKVGVQGKGWDDMARAVGKVHDNSIA